VVGSCEQSNEFSGSLKGEEFIAQLSYCQILKKDCSMKLVTSPIPRGALGFFCFPMCSN
jgi:hypothetical protein